VKQMLTTDLPDPVLPRFDAAVARTRGALPRSFAAPIFGLWDLTYRCTLNCVHCFNDSGPHNRTGELDRHEALEVADQIIASRVLQMCLSGGDALLHPAVFDCARKLKAAGVTVNTITNGWLVTERIADQMAACFGAVEVSVDGATAATHDAVRGQPGSFERALQAIRRLTVRGTTVTVAFSPTRLNMHEFPAFVELMRGIPGVRLVVTGYILPTGRAYRNPLMPTPEIQERFRADVLAIKARTTDLYVSFADPIAAALRLCKGGLPNPQFEIQANGDIRVAPWLPIVFGNVLTDGLMPVWQRYLAHAWTDPAVTTYVRDVHDTFTMTHQDRVPWVDPPLHYDELVSQGENRERTNPD